MPTLFIIIGKAKAKTKNDDKVVKIDFTKYHLGDIPKLLALAKVVSSGKVDKEAFDFLGIKEDEIKKYDKIKICLEESLAKVIAGKVKVKDVGYDLFSCE